MLDEGNRTGPISQFHPALRFFSRSAAGAKRGGEVEAVGDTLGPGFAVAGSAPVNTVAQGFGGRKRDRSNLRRDGAMPVQNWTCPVFCLHIPKLESVNGYLAPAPLPTGKAPISGKDTHAARC